LGQHLDRIDRFQCLAHCVSKRVTTAVSHGPQAKRKFMFRLGLIPIAHSRPRSSFRYLSLSSSVLPDTAKCPVTIPLEPGCFPPTLTEKSPGSITRLPLSSITDICLAVSVKLTFRLSPRLRWSRSTPARLRIGTGTDAVRSLK